MRFFLLSTSGPAVASEARSARGEFSVSSSFTAAASGLNEAPRVPILLLPAFFDASFKCFDTNSGGTGFLGDSRSFLGDPVGVFTVENSDELLISLDGILDSRSFLEIQLGFSLGKTPTSCLSI